MPVDALGQPHPKQPDAMPSITQSAIKQPAHKPLGKEKIKFNIEREESILILSELPARTYNNKNVWTLTSLIKPCWGFYFIAKCPTRGFWSLMMVIIFL